MTTTRALLSDFPILLRFVLVSAACAGVAGAIVGLILGLRANPATAWFAIFEVGIPALVAGAVLGLAIGLIALAARKVRPR
jgi:hypothetical protein